MSVEQMAIVLHHSRATGTAKVVLLGIANHDGDGGAWPSLATLAKYANVDARNVRTALRKLEALGEVRCIRGQGGTHRTRSHERPNLYRILVDCPEDCAGGTQHKQKPRSAGEDGIVLPPPDASDPWEGTAASPEPSLEPSTEPSSGPSDTGLPGGRELRPRRTEKRPSGVQPPLTKAQIQDEYLLLQDVMADEGMDDDPWDVWHTLVLEHGARTPGKWLRARIESGQWDGFLGSHGIGDYSHLKPKAA